MSKKNTYREIAFIGAVAIALVAIVYFSLNPNQESKANITASTSTNTSANVQNNKVTAVVTNDANRNQPSLDVKTISESKQLTADVTEEPKSESKPDTKTASQSIQAKEPIKTQIQNSQVSKSSEIQKQTGPSTKIESTITKEAPIPKADNVAIKILKSEVTSTAKFYPYKLDGITMEVIAVKATDGTIRTALNTCQICFDSGRGYYEQVGEFLICQNCRNKFHVDQVEKVKGGCNPVPIMQENKQDNGEYILVSKDFMVKQKEFFSNWKKK